MLENSGLNEKYIDWNLVCEAYCRETIYLSHNKQKCVFQHMQTPQGPDEFVHLHSLIRTSAVCWENHWLL